MQGEMTGALRRNILPLIAALLLLTSPACRAQTITRWIILVDAQNPPLAYREQNQTHGLYPFLIDQIARVAGVPVEIRASARIPAMLLMENGAASIGGLYKNAQRLKQFDFSAPLYTEKVILAYDKRHPLRFHGLQDLNNKRIGTLVGWSYGDDFDKARNSGQFVSFQNNTDQINLELLSNGLLDAIVGLDAGVRAALTSNPAAFKNIVVAHTPISVNQAYIAVKKDSPLLPSFLKFNTSMLAMQKDGRYQRLLKQYLLAHKP